MAVIRTKKPGYKKSFCSNDYSPPFIEKIHAERNSVAQYEKFELDITLDTDNSYHNPYDPGEIDLSAVFMAPGGQKFKVPGFIYQGFSLPSRSVKIGDMALSSAGTSKPVWKIRFAPERKGKWSYRVTVRNPAGKHTSKVLSFKCLSSRHPGFIRTSKKDNRYFQFDSGKNFYAIGENLCWVEPDDPFGIEDYFDRLSASQQNWIRVWPWPFYLIMEWSKPRAQGLGRFSQTDSWRFDRLIELARKKGAYIQLVLNYHGMFIQGAERGEQWQNNPYNKTLNGPCKKPEDFFNNEEAKKLFKRRLRYLVARWGYSPNILGWEFFNNVDLIKNVNENDIVKWHKEMAHYLKLNDPFHHLLTTSFARPNSGDKVWRLKEIDYTQIHNYVNDVITLIDYFSRQRTRYKKPAIMGEIAGAVTEAKTEAQDKNGIRLHNSIWASLMSPLAGTAMYWWWDGHLRINNLYYHYKALGEFTRDIDWQSLRLTSVEVKIDVKDSDRDDVIIPAILDWELSTGSKFVIGSDGVVKSDGVLSKYFQGFRHSEWKLDPGFDVTYLTEGTFSVYLAQPSNLGTKLKIVLDDKVVFGKEFPPTKDYITLNEEYKIKVPAGRHMIKIVNDGDNWVNISWIKIGNKSFPRIRVVGLQNNKLAMLWCVNRQSTAESYLEHLTLQPITGARIKICGLVKGNYKVEYWDTRKGKIFKTEDTVSDGRMLELNLPPITNDVACKIKRRG